jgi:hypothetical protein
MQTATPKKEFVTFSPDLRGDDPCANYWMRQVTFRLRREVCWCWQERGAQMPRGPAALPPFSDKASSTLDMSRFWAEKQNFNVSDPTAKYLTEQLLAQPPPARKPVARGSFGWVVRELELDEVATFVLALSLVAAVDASMGSVIATCLNDQTRTQPNLALAQRLWDRPNELLGFANPFHPLFRYGLSLQNHARGHSCAETFWDAPLVTSSLVAQQLLSADVELPHGLAPLNGVEVNGDLAETVRLSALRLAVSGEDQLALIPVLGPKGCERSNVVAAIAGCNGKQAAEFQGEVALLDDRDYLSSIATVCWLRDTYLFFVRQLPGATGEKHGDDQFNLPAHTIPAKLFLSLSDRHQLARLPANLLLPVVEVPASTYEQRTRWWHEYLGSRARGLGKVIAESARRFRFEKETIRVVCEGLRRLPQAPKSGDVVGACRAELDSDLSDVANRVAPRFDHEELILPHKQRLQFQEIVKAMRSLTEVHYVWGTAKVWNEGGISVLFAGPPGTGKTMGAEILALKLDLPMYRIDLSQVVNKYIGETEKNLKRVFDAADQSDMILFFDEADSLFGRRTEVSDAHDRYANLEISYLLERMERFKGLAILATNRKKDLDEAFLRRLRYIIDFPLPEVKERERIWRQVMPENVDSSQLEFRFLAERFPLAGGNIRSIVFNACLQCADGSRDAAKTKTHSLAMNEVVIAVKREYDKVNRKLPPQQYGPYAPLVEGLELEQANNRH